MMNIHMAKDIFVSKLALSAAGMYLTFQDYVQKEGCNWICVKACKQKYSKVSMTINYFAHGGIQIFNYVFANLTLIDPLTYLSVLIDFRNMY